MAAYRQFGVLEIGVEIKSREIKRIVAVELSRAVMAESVVLISDIEAGALKCDSIDSQE